MQCTYHFQNAITFICLAPHNCECQRKLCAQCLYEHGVEIKQAIPIQTFHEMALQKLKEYKLDETSTKQRIDFKSMLSQTEAKLKKICQDLSLSIQYIYDQIEKQNQFYIKIMKQSPGESSYTDLEVLVSIVEGRTLIDWNNEKNLNMKILETIKIRWEQGINSFAQNFNEIRKKLKRIQPYYEPKEDLLEILDYVEDIDEKIFNQVIESCKNQKISDCIGFLQNTDAQKLFGSKFFSNILKNIFKHQFSIKDYSKEDFDQIRELLIQKISKSQKFIHFFKFLIHLTAIDQKFVQCGSNSLFLLVKLKVDLTNQSFENIRIKNTSLIGANFLKCNLSGSEFENVNISGVNLNGALLLNCKWKNINIQELNKLIGHTSYVQSVCFSPEGTTLASSSGDNSIRLWDIKTGQQKSKLDGHISIVYQVCFSPDGNTLASGSGDNSIRLWDIQTGQQKAKLEGQRVYMDFIFYSLYASLGEIFGRFSGDSS